MEEREDQGEGPKMNRGGEIEQVHEERPRTAAAEGGQAGDGGTATGGVGLEASMRLYGQYPPPRYAHPMAGTRRVLGLLREDSSGSGDEQS